MKSRGNEKNNVHSTSEMLKAEADVVRVIMDRGEEFSPGEAIAVQNRFAGQTVPQDDGGEAVP